MQEPVEGQEVRISPEDQVLSRIDGMLKIGDAKQRKQETSNFINERLESLVKTSSSNRDEGFDARSPIHKGFLHPDYRIKKNFIYDPFCVNDNEIYGLLLDVFTKYKHSPDWQNKDPKEIVPSAIITTINDYFGNPWGIKNIVAENQKFYAKHSGSPVVSSTELKGKRIAVCLERASTAQNLLAFLGYEVELIDSFNCRLTSLEPNHREGHLFNIINSQGSHFIFDPSNPFLIKDEKEKVVSFIPASYKISEEEYQGLKKGGQVGVTYYEYKKLKTGQVVKKGEAKLAYGGDKC